MRDWDKFVPWLGSSAGMEILTRFIPWRAGLGFFPGGLSLEEGVRGIAELLRKDAKSRSSSAIPQVPQDGKS